MRRKAIIVDFEGNDSPFDFSDGFNIETDHVRSYHSWAAALNCIITGHSYLSTDMLDVDSIICVVKSLRSIKDCIALLKMYHFDKVILSYKDDLDRFSVDAINLNYIKALRQLSSLCHCFIYSHKLTINLIGNFLHCKSVYFPLGVARNKLQHLFVKPSDRNGILVRQPKTRASRNTLSSIVTALIVGKETHEHVEIVSRASGDIAQFLSKLVSYDNCTVTKIMPYYKWMKKLASKKCVIDCDYSFTPGQILTDCTAVGVPCFGSMNNSGGYDFSKLSSCNVEFIIRHITYNYRVLCTEIFNSAEAISLPTLKRKFLSLLG